MEQKLNDHTTESYRFEHFFGRKVAMTLDASGYVYCGGGFGTFDELFEVLTLMQTGIVPKVPVILLGVDFWTPLDTYIRETLLEKFETIDSDDPDLYIITDDIDLATNTILDGTREESRTEMFERAYRFKDRWVKEGKR